MLASNGHSKSLFSFYTFVTEKKRAVSPLPTQTSLEDETAQQTEFQPLA